MKKSLPASVTALLALLIDRIGLEENTADDESNFYNKNDELEFLKFAELSIDEKEIILAYRTAENKEQLFKMITERKKSD